MRARVTVEPEHVWSGWSGVRGEAILRLVSFLEPGDMETTTTFIVSFVSLCC